jgi:hypothetical protein
VCILVFFFEEACVFLFVELRGAFHVVDGCDHVTFNRAIRGEAASCPN